MTKLEKKYRVDTFDRIRRILDSKNLVSSNKNTTYHYYGHQAGNNVTKLVKYSDKQEIHILEESDGIFSLKEIIPVNSVEEGLEWLRSHGFSQIDDVKMQSESYEFMGGLVRLYLIDDWLHSIILSHEGEVLQEVEQELGLTHDDVIEQPYNEYLDSLGKLKSI